MARFPGSVRRVVGVLNLLPSFLPSFRLSIVLVAVVHFKARCRFNCRSSSTPGDSWQSVNNAKCHVLLPRFRPRRIRHAEYFMPAVCRNYTRAGSAVHTSPRNNKKPLYNYHHRTMTSFGHAVTRRRRRRRRRR